MSVLGVTGGIASGKSTLAALLATYGAAVVDADRHAREVLLPGTTAWRQVRERFGPAVVTAGGTVDRAALGRIVFTDPAARADLEQITHPPVLAAIRAELDRLRGTRDVIVLDAPLLAETGLGADVDAAALVTAPLTARLHRLVSRGLDAAQAHARVTAQWDDTRRLVRLRRDLGPGRIRQVDGGGTPEQLAVQARELLVWLHPPHRN